ncbi:MAG: response regulator transcription factor [Alphaproteobacteria bacterium]|nr:response regulator transcription factor [Alphaproteobacteria bacterium]
MSDQNAILIIEPDETGRVWLEKLLLDHGVAGFCHVAARLPSSQEAGSPVLWIMSRGDPLPDIPGLQPDDIFGKPLRAGVLLDRIGVHIRAVKGGYSSSEPVDMPAIGPYRLDAAHDRLILPQKGKTPEQIIRLTEKESRILMLLYENKGESIDRQSLLDQIWAYVDTVETHTLETHIYRLRQKIEQNPAAPEILLTDGQGYRLN